jgi:ATP-dependent Clp protease ATP-binding subunit ClpC
MRFDSSSALPFSLASFQLLYNSIVLKFCRTALLLGILLYAMFRITTGMHLIDLPEYIGGLFIFWEIFYFLKINTLNIGKEIRATDNMADSFSTRAAKILLQAGSTDLGKILAVTARTMFSQFVMQKADLSIDKLPNIRWGSWESFLTAITETVKSNGWKYVTEHDILAALAKVDGPLKKALFDNEVKPEDLDSILFWAVNEENESERLSTLEKGLAAETKGIAEDWFYGYTLALDRYSHDITHDLTSGRAKPYLVGREEQLNLLQKTLARSKRSNALLVGEDGSGKTTIVQLLAQRSYQGQVIRELRFKRFLQLNITSLLAGAGEGELETRVKELLADAERAGNIVLVIPDLEYLAGAEEGLTKVDLTGSLMEALDSERFQVIGLIDHAGYKRYLEPHRNLLSAFERIEVPSLSLEATIKTLEEIAPSLERRHHVYLSYKALRAVVELSDRYLPEKDLPGKAIELLDEVAVEASGQNKTTLTADDVATLVSNKTHVPLGKVASAEKEMLLNLEQDLHQRIVGQNEAISAVSNALRRSRAGLRDEKRPIGVFLFLGPTGVGKTETSKALAEIYFGNEKSMIRLDMSEYATADSQNKLIGSTNEPGNLTDLVHHSPHSLILLDEIEKAHPQILNTFLQVFDDGRLTDGLGRTIDFTNSIIIATSNAGDEEIRQIIQSGEDLLQYRGVLIDQLLKKGLFRPEFINRFDEVVLFRTLNLTEVVQVVNRMLQSLADQLKKQDITFYASPEAAAIIAQTGFDQVFGARPLRRYIQDHVESMLSKKLLTGEVKRGDTITLKPEDLELGTP